MTRFKICGLRDPANAQVAVDAVPDKEEVEVDAQVEAV